MKKQVSQVFHLLHRYPACGRLWLGRSISLFGDIQYFTKSEQMPKDPRKYFSVTW